MARILPVEDEMLVRELALEDLTDAGFEVVDASDADVALVILQKDRAFDLLFTDIRMPSEIDGWELAAESQAPDPRSAGRFCDRLQRQRWPPLRRRPDGEQTLPQGSSAELVQ